MILLSGNVHVLISQVSLPVSDLFDWDVLKHGELEQFCIGDLLIYTFVKPSHP